MKKRLLLFASLCAFFSFNLSAQSVTYTPSALVANTSARSTLASANNITIEQIGSQQTQPGGAATPFYLELNNNNNALVTNSTGNDAILISSTTANIKKVVLTFRGNNSTNIANPYVGYGTTAEGTYTDCMVHPTGNPANGEVVATYLFPTPAKYVIIVRSSTLSCSGSALNANTPRISYIAVSDVQTVLPLDFISFTAKPDAFGKAVNLTWKTTNEVNTKDFEIERRTDATSFAPIGNVQSKNTPGINTYTFLDKNPAQGTAYYRLKQIDNDGKFVYSDIVDANIKLTATLKLYPNPVKDNLTVDHGYLEKGGTLKVVGLDGKNYLQQTIAPGSSSSSLNVSSLATGTYLLIYQYADQKVSQKFIKN